MMNNEHTTQTNTALTRAEQLYKDKASGDTLLLKKSKKELTDNIFLASVKAFDF